MAQLWFKFWAKEYLADTKVRRLSYEQRGILQTLWAFAWEEGSIPNDMEELGNMLGINAKAMRTHCEWIYRFFAEAPGDASKLISPRLELDRAEADAKGSKARESAMQRWSQRNANASANASANAMRTHLPTQCDGPCVSHAGQGQGKERETTTPLPPKGGSQRKRRTRDEITAPYSEAVRQVVNASLAMWRKEDDDGRAITPDPAALCINVDLILKDHPDATAELLIDAAKSYLSKPKFRFCAPQFFFGPGRRGEGPPHWIGEFRLAQHQAARKAELEAARVAEMAAAS